MWDEKTIHTEEFTIPLRDVFDSAIEHRRDILWDDRELKAEGTFKEIDLLRVFNGKNTVTVEYVREQIRNYFRRGNLPMTVPTQLFDRILFLHNQGLPFQLRITDVPVNATDKIDVIVLEEDIKW